MGLKLQQGQVWKKGNEYIRIVELERLEVGYKIMKNIESGEGRHERLSKKEFCRFIKTATLVPDPNLEKKRAQDRPRPL